MPASSIPARCELGRERCVAGLIAETFGAEMPSTVGRRMWRCKQVHVHLCECETEIDDFLGASHKVPHAFHHGVILDALCERAQLPGHVRQRCCVTDLCSEAHAIAGRRLPRQLANLAIGMENFQLLHGFLCVLQRNSEIVGEPIGQIVFDTPIVVEGDDADILKNIFQIVTLNPSVSILAKVLCHESATWAKSILSPLDWSMTI